VYPSLPGAQAGGRQQSQKVVVVVARSVMQVGDHSIAGMVGGRESEPRRGRKVSCAQAPSGPGIQWLR